MCFSAGASFTASILLLASGAITLKRVHHRTQQMIALFPIMFGIQQAAEGFVWVSLANNNEQLATISSYIFLFFAFFFWPVWIPFTLRKFEPARRHAIGLTLIAGVIIGTALLANLFLYGVQIQATCNHIVYITAAASQQFWLLGMALYLIAVVLPFFLVKNTYVRGIGILGVISYAISYYFYNYALVSVWCFFAALLSIASIILTLQYKPTGGRR
jgi:hypothetical protein